MLHERIAIPVWRPSQPPPDQYDAPAREIAGAVLTQPVPCCEDDSCSAYRASMRWWQVQTGLRRAISSLTLLIDDHDASEGANCLCANLVESRGMRGALVVLWQRTAGLLERMDAQAKAQFAAERGEGG